jgi:hypothetical protein
MNSGVRDAHNLAWKLAAVVKGSLGEGVLDSYERERAPHAAALIQLAINIGRVMMPTSPLQATLVQSGFRAAGFVPPLHAYFAQMKYKPKPFYRDGFLVAGDALRLVGRMFPQPTLEMHDRSLVKLDDLVGNDPCALIPTRPLRPTFPPVAILMTCSAARRRTGTSSSCSVPTATWRRRPASLTRTTLRCLPPP